MEKGYSMYIYDFKFSDLSTIAYNHMMNHQNGYKVKPQFYVINFAVTLDYKAPLAAAIMLMMIAMMVFDFIPVAPVTAVMIAGLCSKDQYIQHRKQ